MASTAVFSTNKEVMMAMVGVLWTGKRGAEDTLKTSGMVEVRECWE